MANAVSEGQIHKEYQSIITLLIILIVLVILAIVLFFVFFILRSPSLALQQQNLSAQANIYYTYIHYRPIPLANAQTVCHDLLADNSIQAYCETFQNVNISGETYFAGCDTPVMRENNTLCIGVFRNLSTFCDNNHLSNNELLGIRDSYISCYEVRTHSPSVYFDVPQAP